MKETPLTQAVEEFIELEEKVIDLFIQEVIEPLEEVGSPEKLLRKPYEEWTREDFLRAGQVYGEEPNPLSNLIFKKEYAKTLKMERELGG